MNATLEDNHIALLQHRAKHGGNAVLFKLPILTGSSPPKEWKDITVSEFAADVDRVARFMVAELKAREIPPRSVISVHSGLLPYQDLVYTIALTRASYVPQLFPPVLTHPETIFALMKKAESKMILYHPALEHLTAICPFSKMAMIPIENIESCSVIKNDSTLPTIEDLSSGSDICFVFLTSGSTSGSPKIVPWSHKFISIYYKSQFGTWLDGRHFNTQDVFISRGGTGSIAAMIHYLGCLYYGACIVHPSKMRYSTEELLNMVNVCGLNRLTTFGTWLAPYIQAAKKDPTILKLLREMRTVSYGGVPISIADDDWCFQNGITLKNMYCSTECGHLMAAVPGKPARFLQPVSGLSHRFDPSAASVEAIDSPQLFQFILLADSPQIPQPHLLSGDGNFHTGDLFEKQPDGSYLFRGRTDDWIKSLDADFIDTRFIEEKVYEICSDLAKEFLVVGQRRPSPALFLEVNRNALLTISKDSLKEKIFRRLEDFNSRQYKHERIADQRLIFIVDEAELPRTHKGNFRRRETEKKYEKELDAAYKSVYGS